MNDQARELLKSKQEKNEHNQDMKKFVEGKEHAPDLEQGVSDQNQPDQQNRMKDQENRIT
ncbi:hypothetical protein [Paenibacillus hunanensis]|uniref:DUF4025 domain-containing protein n=1 Tax=Paenibacillus hunanensis TaxID=539262 RepID=A0ABU1IX48_9BACL|nr:hypothetical protein [Paenibacillus hunanensis]MCL9659294.1 hypothetical protein [Paenibacillus hunanensis]MDR6243575.1 hypothetical protein [Paenibacillus hunanensis]WPP40328.1 hypothetical protein SK066_17185 [Paenibacillus hunanensis]GGI98816.1 hypothetical protein GCM10008022_04370 [Paenibacillus hunanensis]